MRYYVFSLTFLHWQVDIELFNVELFTKWIFTGWNLTFQLTEWWLNGGWMATELWRERWISVAIQPPFSQLNGRHISVTFQSVYFFWKIKLRSMQLEPGLTKQKESTPTIRPRGPLGTVMIIQYLCSVCLILYLKHVFLIFYSFFNQQLYI